MKEFNISVGERIRKLREEYGYTRETLAEVAGMNDKFLYEVEIGKKGLSAYKMSKLADTLGVSMDYLVTGESKHKEYEKIMILLRYFSDAGIKNLEDIIRNIIKISNYVKNKDN